MSRVHPSHSAYVGGCREPDCKRAHADYVRDRKRATAKVTKVAAIPFTRVLGELYIRGIEVREMVAVTGCSASTVRHVLWAEQRMIWQRTADRLLSLVYLFPKHERPAIGRALEHASQAWEVAA